MTDGYVGKEIDTKSILVVFTDESKMKSGKEACVDFGKS